jgi:acyl dehydratase
VSADEVSVGDTGPTVVVEDVRREDFVKFAGCTGDFNELHYDEPAARAAGYDSVFAPGMLSGGYATRLLTAWFGLANLESVSVRFDDQVWPGDTLTVTGEVTAIDADGDGAVVDVDFAVTDDDGTDVVTGTATARTVD